MVTRLNLRDNSNRNLNLDLHSTSLPIVTDFYMAMTMHRITGTNNVPLGPRGQINSAKTNDPNLPFKSESIVPLADRADVPSSALAKMEDIKTDNRGHCGQRKTRFSPETSAKSNKILSLLGMPTALTSTMTPEQIEAYALDLRIKEISQKIYINDVIPPSHGRSRSRSPPPQYDNFGHRTNTRQVRYRTKLEDERHRLVQTAMRIIPEFKPPSDYRLVQRTQEKIYIPVNDYPEINFIGQILGSRGVTLKDMCVRSGAKIFIRGKGSVKEGKSLGGKIDYNLDEDLHCLIIADSEEKIATAVSLVEGVIEMAASTPESENEHKRGQLRDVARNNGTLRDDEGKPCDKCGEMGHRRYNCPNRDRFYENVVCRNCGQPGHFMRDCKVKGEFNAWKTGVGGGDTFEREYQDLMTEVGGGSIVVGPSMGYIRNGGQATPWNTAPWEQPMQPAYQQAAYEQTTYPQTTHCWTSPFGTSSAPGVAPGGMTYLANGPPPTMASAFPPPLPTPPPPATSWNKPPPPPPQRS